MTKRLVSFKRREYGKDRFPDKTFGFGAVKFTTAGQISIVVSRKATETFEAYFKRISGLPSPSMAATLPLKWKQKNVKRKLSEYSALKEKYDNLCLHTGFVVRKFRQGSSAQSAIDHIFAQVLFYDQAKLRILDSRNFESD